MIMYVQLLVVELGTLIPTYLYFLASVAAGSLLGTLKAIDGAIETVQNRSLPLSKPRSRNGPGYKYFDVAAETAEMQWEHRSFVR